MKKNNPLNFLPSASLLTGATPPAHLELLSCYCETVSQPLPIQLKANELTHLCLCRCSAALDAMRASKLSGTHHRPHLPCFGRISRELHQTEQADDIFLSLLSLLFKLMLEGKS